MKNKVIFIAAYIVFLATDTCGQAGVEQYYYMQDKEAVVFVPIVNFQAKNNWYGEARYNYEEQKTFSIYAGRKFSGQYKKLSYSLTPIMGAVMGELDGASAGVNVSAELRDFFFSSQSQYTFSPNDPACDFLFRWSELGYEVSSWFYLGLSMQHTRMLHTHSDLFEHGAVIGFEFGNWTIPIYSFSTFNRGRYFVLGINFGIGTK